MAGASAPYTARFIGPDELEREIANTISCPVYRSGALVAPSSGTVSVYNPAGVAVVDAAAVTVTGSIATYTITAGTLTNYGYDTGWRIEWNLTISAAAFNARNDAVLVYRCLWPVITDLDIQRFHTDLPRRLPSGESSYQDYIDEAWAQIKSRLVTQGVRPHLILSPSALRSAHLYLTLALVFGDFATGGSQSAEGEARTDYRALYEAEWARLTFAQATEAGDLASRRRRAVEPVLFTCGRG